jgi:hypothetical protein
MPAGQADQLGAGRSPRRDDGRLGERRLVLVAHQDEQRASHPRRVTAWPVEGEAEGRPGGDHLLPVRVPVFGVERPAGVETVRDGEDRDGARLAAERHQHRIAATTPPRRSRAALAVKRSMASGFWWRDALRVVARPSAFGVCAITAASPGLRAPTRKRWPPVAEPPPAAIRVGSTPGRVAAKSIAACQSASWSLTGRTRRGRPPLSPRRR